MKFLLLACFVVEGKLCVVRQLQNGKAAADMFRYLLQVTASTPSTVLPAAGQAAVLRAAAAAASGMTNSSAV